MGGATFTMSGGEISGNRATDRGGGVGAWGNSFKKMPPAGSSNSGVISGSDAAVGERNIANRGQAVLLGDSIRRDTTAGEDVSLDGTISGAAGGWE
jgi:hypothetical protein